MSGDLLQTKLYVPRLRPSLIPRPHLISRLNQGLQPGCKLILISAPAGFGKTTLIVEWATALSRGTQIAESTTPYSTLRIPHLCWLSLDEGDDDFSRWLAYFIAALQTIAPSIGDAALAMRQSLQPSSAEPLLTNLINEIAAIPESFLFVLDDYHLIQDQSIHDAVRFLLDHLPENMRLVIATRADPPLPLPRLRTRGQLVELRENHLRFAVEEAALFLNEVMGFDLTAEAVAALENRTEGWIAGLQLAALSLQEQSDKERFVETFTGSHRYVLDYLAEEVWNQQPTEVQSFLLQTAVLNRMTAPLCDALTGRDDGQATLEHLETANLFTQSLDNERCWYRYHQLFADLLRKRLQEQQPECITALHQQASAWLEQNGHVTEAIRHALAATDFEGAVRLIEDRAEAVLLRSEGTTLLKWVDALPEALVQERPFLRLYYAWALLMGGRPVDLVESMLPDGETVAEDVKAGANALRAFIAIMQGQVQRSADLSRHALSHLPQESLFFRSLAAWTVSFAHLAEGDLMGGLLALEEAVRLGRETGNIMTAVMALCGLAELQMTQGKLHTVAETYQQALELGRDRRGRPLPIAGMALIGLGELARERNDLETAVDYLSQGIERAGQWGEVGALDGHIGLARVKQAQGDLTGADAEIAQAVQLARKFDATDIDDNLVHAHRVRLSLLRGDGDTAVRWAALRGLNLEAALAGLESDIQTFDSRRFRTAEYLNLARLLIYQAQHDEALTLLERLTQRVGQHGRNGVLIEIYNIQTLALYAQGQESEAIAVLSRALALAEPEAFARIFLDEGAVMLHLLQVAAAREIAPDYVCRLLAMVGEDTAVAPATSPLLLEPLSEREREVLQLLTTGLTNPEIAQELFIATSTVRSHVKSIYSKLNVHRRWDAVQRAQELGLI